MYLKSAAWKKTGDTKGFKECCQSWRRRFQASTAARQVWRRSEMLGMLHPVKMANNCFFRSWREMSSCFQGPWRQPRLADLFFFLSFVPSPEIIWVTGEKEKGGEGPRVGEMQPSGRLERKIAEQRLASKLLLPFNAPALQQKSDVINSDKQPA